MADKELHLSPSMDGPLQDYFRAEEELADSATRTAYGLLTQHTQKYGSKLKHQFEALNSSSQSLAESLLMAILLTSDSSFSGPHVCKKWDDRPGWSEGTITTIVHMAEVAAGQIVHFGCEVRHGKHTRQLAILLDLDRPGERLRSKTEKEKLLSSLGFRILTFTEAELIGSSDNCHDRVQGLLAEMAGEVDHDEWDEKHAGA